MVLFFFFFKQKTAYEMRISDWSSDVCSSDLVIDLLGLGPGDLRHRRALVRQDGDQSLAFEAAQPLADRRPADPHPCAQLGFRKPLARLKDAIEDCFTQLAERLRLNRYRLHFQIDRISH